MTLAWALPGTAISAPMCGRYASFLPAEALARIFGATNPLPNLAPSWNVAPTNEVAVVRRHPDSAELGPAAVVARAESPRLVACCWSRV